MNIFKIKLLNKGYYGVKVWYNEIVKGEKISLKDPVERTRKTPLNTESLVILDKLKYAYLHCSGHWIQPYNKYYDLEEMELAPIPAVGDMPAAQEWLRGLFNKVNIVEVKITDASFTMKAECEFVPGKPKTYEIGPIVEEDDFSFFVNTMDTIDNLMDSVSDFINAHALPVSDAKKYLENASSLSIDEIADLTEEEMLGQAIALLEKNGAILLFDTPPAIESGEGTVEVKTSGSIDSHHINDKTDELSEEAKIYAGEEKAENQSDDEGESELPEDASSDLQHETASNESDIVSESGAEHANKEEVDGDGLSSIDKTSADGITSDEALRVQSGADIPSPDNDINKVPEKVNPFGPPAAGDSEFPIDSDEKPTGSGNDFEEEVPLEPVPGTSELDDEIGSW